MRKKKSLGSIITGMILGILLGIWLNLIFSFPMSIYIYTGIGFIFFGFLGFKKPKTAEIIAYAISIFIFLQMSWDYVVGDRGEIRLMLFYVAIVLLIINIFSGYYGWSKPKKMAAKALGI